MWTAWTTWSGCAGRLASCVRVAATPGAGGSVTAGSSAPNARPARRLQRARSSTGRARREPHRQRRARPVEDRARCSRRAGLAFGALEPAVTEPPAPGVAATRTHEASRPAQPLQVVQAVHIGRKPRLELAHRSRVAHVSARMLHDPKLLRLHG